MRRDLSRLAGYDDFARIARRRVPRGVFDFIEGGAGAEAALDDAVAAFRRLPFEPRWLVDVSQRDTTTTVLGQTWSMPIGLAPAGMAGLAHPGAELAVARAAGRAGTAFCLSAVSTRSIEEVAAVASGPLWLQLFPWKSDRDLMRMLDRARDAGFSAVVLTVDSPLGANRERDVRNEARLPPRIRPRMALDAARRPAWVLGYFLRARLAFGNIVELAGSRDMRACGMYIGTQLIDTSATWERLDFIRRHWDGPLAVKGILSAHDAREAAGRGADAVYVSSHGGRQLDSTLAPLDALSRVVDAVGGRCEVLLDGGVRRGEDAVKARALGARAVLVGRPWVMPLAAAGEAGVERMLELFRSDVDRTLGLIGVPRLDDVTGAVLAGRAAGSADS